MFKQKVFVRGVDKQGRALMIMHSREHKGTVDEEFIVAQIYMMERAIACTEFISAGAEEKITVVFELYTFKSSLAPTWGAIKQMASILQNCYSERLKGLIIIDPPLWARTMYGLLKPFLDPGEKDKDDVVEREDVSLAFRSLTQPPNLFWFPCCCCCLRVSNPRQIFGGDW